MGLGLGIFSIDNFYSQYKTRENDIIVIHFSLSSCRHFFTAPARDSLAAFIIIILTDFFSTARAAFYGLCDIL